MSPVPPNNGLKMILSTRSLYIHVHTLTGIYIYIHMHIYTRTDVYIYAHVYILMPQFSPFGTSWVKFDPD